MPKCYQNLQSFVAAFLSYALIIVVCTPFTLASAAVETVTHPASASTAPQQTAARRAGEILVRFRARVSQQAQDVLFASHGARRQRSLRGESRVEKVELTAGQEPFAVSAQMRLDPQVEFAEPNFLIEKSDLTPNDPSFGESGL